MDNKQILKGNETDEKAGNKLDYQEKNAKIEKEVRRLRRLFSKIDKNKKNLVYTTIDDVAFMSVTMQELQEKIIRDGTSIKYQNGENQWGKKQSPDAQLYLQMSQKKTQAMKILIDCMPKTEQISKEIKDGFDEFVSGREDV